VVQVADAAAFVAELRRIVAAECRAWGQVVRDEVDDAGPPSSAVEQLHLLSGQFVGLCELNFLLMEYSVQYIIE